MSKQDGNAEVAGAEHCFGNYLADNMIKKNRNKLQIFNLKSKK